LQTRSIPRSVEGKLKYEQRHKVQLTQVTFILHHFLKFERSFFIYLDPLRTRIGGRTCIATFISALHYLNSVHADVSPMAMSTHGNANFRSGRPPVCQLCLTDFVDQLLRAKPISSNGSYSGNFHFGIFSRPGFFFQIGFFFLTKGLHPYLSLNHCFFPFCSHRFLRASAISCNAQAGLDQIVKGSSPFFCCCLYFAMQLSSFVIFKCPFSFRCSWFPPTVPRLKKVLLVPLDKNNNSPNGTCPQVPL
jgi:hypothetical protein